MFFSNRFTEMHSLPIVSLEFFFSDKEIKNEGFQMIRWELFYLQHHFSGPCFFKHCCIFYSVN